MGEVIELAFFGERDGNEAREALMREFARAANPGEIADTILAMLWRRGFKVVPLDTDDAA